MRTLVIPVGILAAILAVSLWAGQFVDRQTEAWSALLEQADAQARSENWEDAQATVQEVLDRWEKQETFFHTIMEHDALDEAHALLSGTLAACRERDNEDFHILLVQLLCQMDHLRETQAVSIKNIF